MANAGGAAAQSEDEGAAVDVLPESVISLILSKLLDARKIARAATVCRRWRTCAFGVTSMHLNFSGNSSCCDFHFDEDDDEDVDDDEEDMEDGNHQVSDDDDHSETSDDECCCHDFHRRKSFKNSATTLKRCDEFSRFVMGCVALRELSISGMYCFNRRIRTVLDKWLDGLPPCLEEFRLQGRFNFSLERLFHCTKLVRLDLHSHGISLLDIPTGCPQFNSITTCILTSLRINDAKLQLLVGLCPNLQDLQLRYLHGVSSPVLKCANLQRLTVVSRSPKNILAIEVEEDLEIVRVDGIQTLKISAPNLESLAVTGVGEVQADGGPALTDLAAGSYFVPVFRKKTSNLRDIALLGKGWGSMNRVMEFLGLASEGAQKLVMDIQYFLDEHSSGAHRVTFEELVSHFTELTNLEIGKTVFEYLEDADDPESQAKIDLPLLRELSVGSERGVKSTISLVDKIVRSAPRLSRMEIHLSERPSGSFSTALLKLQATRPQVSFEVQTLDSTDEENESDYEDGRSDDEWREEDYVEEDGDDDESDSMVPDFTTDSSESTTDDE